MNLNFIKTYKIILSIVIIVLVLEGLFLWFALSREPVDEIIPPEAEDFEVVTSDLGERFIVSGKRGIRAEIPEGWSVEKHREGIDINGPKIEMDEYWIPPDNYKKGSCGAGIYILKGDESDLRIPHYVVFLYNEIRRIEEKGGSYKGFNILEEIILVSGYIGIKNTFITDDGIIVNVEVEIPMNNMVYSFTSGVTPAEKCVNQFNDFLETVSIDK